VTTNSYFSPYENNVGYDVTGQTTSLPGMYGYFSDPENAYVLSDETDESGNRIITRLFGIAWASDDGDGVPASTEDQAPNNGDGNGDGTPDRLQSGVTSLPSATGRGFITVELRNGDCNQLTEVTALGEGQTPASDASFDYPFGLVSFQIPCESATVRVYFHGTTSLSGYTYRKYGPTTPGVASTAAWYSLPNVSFGTANIGGTNVPYAQFTLTDGSLGDDTDGADNIIYDQGGPGFPGGSTTSVPAMNGFGAATLSMLLLLAGVYAWRKKAA